MTGAPPVPPPLPPPPFEPPRGGEEGGTPWERRDRIGFVNAIVETTQQVLFRPSDFFARMPTAGGVGGPLLYGVIVGYVGLVAQALYGLVFNSMLGPGLMRFGRHGEFARLAPFLHSGMTFAGQLVLGPIGIVIGLFVAAGLLHVFLMLLGGANRDFETTFRVVSYSHAVSLLNLVPLCGGLIGAVWWIVVAATGLTAAHQTSQGKAIAAVLLPILIVCCCCGLVAFMVFGGIASVLGHLR